MNIVFNYTQPGAEIGAEDKLALRVGDHDIACLISNSSCTEIRSVTWCKIDELTEENFHVFCNNHLSGAGGCKLKRILIEVPEVLVLPRNSMENAEAINELASLYGYIGAIANDSLDNWQLSVRYRLPDVLNESMHGLAAISGAKYLHEYTSTILNLDAQGEEGKLLVDFGRQQFSVVAARGNKFLFAGTFVYETPDDVLYYLLRVCQQLGFSTQSVDLRLSGLIEKDSALFKELYQYFLVIAFREADWGAVNDLPSHYFTTLNDLLKCEL